MLAVGWLGTPLTPPPRRCPQLRNPRAAGSAPGKGDPPRPPSPAPEYFISGLDVEAEPSLLRRAEEAALCRHVWVSLMMEPVSQKVTRCGSRGPAGSLVKAQPPSAISLPMSLDHPTGGGRCSAGVGKAGTGLQRSERLSRAWAWAWGWHGLGVVLVSVCGGLWGSVCACARVRVLGRACWCLRSPSWWSGELPRVQQPEVWGAGPHCPPGGSEAPGVTGEG